MWEEMESLLSIDGENLDWQFGRWLRILGGVASVHL